MSESIINVIYERDMEYLFAAGAILSYSKDNWIVKEIYNDDYIQLKNCEFPLLFEVFQNIDYDITMQMLDFILEYGIENFSIKGYFSYLRHVTKEDFLSKLLGLPKNRIEDIINSEKELYAFYQENKDVFKSFFAIEVLFRRTEYLLESYYMFVESLKTTFVEQYINQNSELVCFWKNRIYKELENNDPLEYSENIMCKTFRNRGPYDKFYFMPSMMLPMKCCRWFEKEQFLVFNVTKAYDNIEIQNFLEQLKTISDKTRYSILLLLHEQNSLSGVEIAEKLKIATSTVSHHMTMLKKLGLVYEEPVKATKYYGVNKSGIKNCINKLKEAFEIE